VGVWVERGEQGRPERSRQRAGRVLMSSSVLPSLHARPHSHLIFESVWVESLDLALVSVMVTIPPDLDPLAHERCRVHV
jgi:hypothetical protein